MELKVILARLVEDDSLTVNLARYTIITHYHRNVRTTYSFRVAARLKKYSFCIIIQVVIRKQSFPIIPINYQCLYQTETFWGKVIYMAIINGRCLIICDM